MTNDDGKNLSVDEIIEKFGILETVESVESPPIVESTKMYKFMGQELEKIPIEDVKGKRGQLVNIIVIANNRTAMFTTDPTNNLESNDNPVIRGTTGHFNPIEQIMLEDLRFKGDRNNTVYWVSVSIYK